MHLDLKQNYVVQCTEINFTRPAKRFVQGHLKITFHVLHVCSWFSSHEYYIIGH